MKEENGMYVAQVRKPGSEKRVTVRGKTQDEVHELVSLSKADWDQFVKTIRRDGTKRTRQGDLKILQGYIDGLSRRAPERLHVAVAGVFTRDAPDEAWRLVATFEDREHADTYAGNFEHAEVRRVVGTLFVKGRIE